MLHIRKKYCYLNKLILDSTYQQIIAYCTALHYLHTLQNVPSIASISR